MRKTMALMLLALVCTGCLGQIVTDSMKKWDGKWGMELISKWGPPTRIMSDGSGGQVWIYNRDRSWLYPGYSQTTTNVYGGVYGNTVSGTATSTTVYTPSAVVGYTAYRMFWVHPDGRIYNWAWKGL